jgi:hypothetical protein
VKFVIVQFGSYAFACHWLTLEQWAWCFLFGVGTLLWGQLVTTIPTHSLPKKLEVGNEVPDIAGLSNVIGVDGSADTSELRKGQVLWLRGIARLQTQVTLSLLSLHPFYPHLYLYHLIFYFQPLLFLICGHFSHYYSEPQIDYSLFLSLRGIRAYLFVKLAYHLYFTMHLYIYISISI